MNECSAERHSTFVADDTEGRNLYNTYSLSNDNYLEEGNTSDVSGLSPSYQSFWFAGATFSLQNRKKSLDNHTFL